MVRLSPSIAYSDATHTKYRTGLSTLGQCTHTRIGHTKMSMSVQLILAAYSDTSYQAYWVTRGRHELRSYIPEHIPTPNNAQTVLGLGEGTP